MRILCSNVHLEHRNNAPERQMWRRLKLGDNCRDHLLDRRTFRDQAVGALDRSLEPLAWVRSEEHTSELQSLMRISYAVFCLKKKQRKTAPTSKKLKQLI